MDALSDRVAALLKRYAAVMREQEALRKDLSELQSENDNLRAQLRQAEDVLLASQISKSMPDEHVRAQSRKKLDSVISEIDKILITIND